MEPDTAAIVGLLASALRGEVSRWPVSWTGLPTHDRVVEQILYHGVAGLLIERAWPLDDWPGAVVARLRDQAVGQAMWELRHRELLGPLLAGFARREVPVFLLKGTALAYDLYANPACRSRGDSDILVSRDSLGEARSILAGLGYRPPSDFGELPDDLGLQESWSFDCGDGTPHHIDLHWQALNSHALKDLLGFAEVQANPLRLPRLSRHALAMNRVLTLIHTCAHRAMHVTAPYFVGEGAYFGGDRLIWAYDIHLLASEFAQDDWARLTISAREKGVSRLCRDGLKLAERYLSTCIPDEVAGALETDAGPRRATSYLLEARPSRRAWLDLMAIDGLRRKLAFLLARILPSAAFMRRKYPRMSRLPLALLHARRMVDVLRTRRSRSERE